VLDPGDQRIRRGLEPGGAAQEGNLRLQVGGGERGVGEEVEVFGDPVPQPQGQSRSSIEDEAGRNGVQLAPQGALRRGKDFEPRLEHGNEASPLFYHRLTSCGAAWASRWAEVLEG
jgi:hypothetical protein